MKKKQIAIILSALVTALPITAGAACNVGTATDILDSVNNKLNEVSTSIEWCPTNLSDCRSFINGCLENGKIDFSGICGNLQNGCLENIFGGCGQLPDSNCPGGDCGDGETTPETPDDDVTIPDDGTEAPDGDTVPNGNGGSENTPQAPSEDNTEDSQAGIENESYVNEVISLVNEQRAANGLLALKKDVTLCKAATARAIETVSSFSHTRPNGQSCFTVLDEYGYSYRGAGENIAMGQSSPSEVVNAWMNSEGHRANILNSSFTKIGVGCHSSGSTLYWSQFFTY